MSGARREWRMLIIAALVVSVSVQFWLHVGCVLGARDLKKR